MVTYHIGHLADDIGNIAEPFYDEGPLLHAAAEYGLTEIVERLSQKVSFYDSSPSLLPPESDGDAGKKELYRFCKPGKEDISPILHRACQRRSPNLKMLKLLVEKCNVDVNARSREHQYRYSSYGSEYGDFESTALHWLASADSFWQLDGIRYLIEKGADINVANEKGQTPLYIAAAGYVFTEFLLLHLRLQSTQLSPIDPRVARCCLLSTKHNDSSHLNSLLFLRTHRLTRTYL